MNISTLQGNIQSIINYVEEINYSSYDHYDYYSSKFGILGKKIFSTNKLLGIPLVSLIFLFDTYFPKTRQLFAQKFRSSEAIPVIVSSYLRLFQITKNTHYLNHACDLLSWLQQNATETRHGLGWGLHFDWQGREFIPKGTPCVTLTAYSTEAFLEGYKLTGKKDYLDTALRTSDFVFHDLNRKNKADETALSYTPLDQNYVINANSYAAKILLDTLEYNHNSEKEKFIEKIANYILNQQSPDGSWYYFDRDDVPEKQNFIDSFHTCFVLENLFFIWKWNNNEQIKHAIIGGYKFFKDHFINDDFSVRYYHYYPYPSGIKVDIRGCAEAIYCCALLSEIFSESIDLSIKIANWTINNMQDNDGYFYFRIYRTHKHKMPYMRWGQAPMFNALTYLYLKLENEKSS